jgi:hypothetical protein
MGKRRRQNKLEASDCCSMEQTVDEQMEATEMKWYVCY